MFILITYSISIDLLNYLSNYTHFKDLSYVDYKCSSFIYIYIS